jgi:hypothetical protein
MDEKSRRIDSAAFSLRAERGISAGCEEGWGPDPSWG